MGWSPSRGLGRWGALLVLLVPLGMSGCGVPGSVSAGVYKGQLLKGGNVTFISSRGEPHRLGVHPGRRQLHVAQGAGRQGDGLRRTKSLNPAGKLLAPRDRPPPGQRAGGIVSDNPTGTRQCTLRSPSSYQTRDQSDF